MKVILLKDIKGVGKRFEEQEKRVQEKRGEMMSQSISKLKDVKLTTFMKANENGSLFSSLNKKKISELLKKEGIEIDPEHIKLEEPIKETGSFKIPVSIGEETETYF